jgi:hypothetical protein
MQLVEDTESPRLFHLWSLVGGLSSCLGRRCWYPFGHLKILPNQYIILAGTPGTRKSTAIGLVRKHLEKATGLRFAPEDTGHQRQGFVRALQGPDAPKDETDKANKAAEKLAEQLLQMESSTMMSLAFGGGSDDGHDDEIQQAIQEWEIHRADKHHVVIMSPEAELGQLLGYNNTDMIDFLGPLWNGGRFEYGLKKESVIIEDPLVNMLSATTPMSLHKILPSHSGGQGFMSRIILVYGASKYKIVPRPSRPNEDLVNEVREIYSRIFTEFHGEFSETPEAARFMDELYVKPVEMNDPRFSYYLERRHNHFIKLAMALCASRVSMEISLTDCIEADRILQATERGMPEALGEFGMNPLAALKQNILEYLRQHGTTPTEELRGVFHRDARMAEFTEAAADLIRLNQVSMRQLPNGQQVLVPKVGLKNTEDDMMRALAQA